MQFVDYPNEPYTELFSGHTLLKIVIPRVLSFLTKKGILTQESEIDHRHDENVKELYVLKSDVLINTNFRENM